MDYRKKIFILVVAVFFALAFGVVAVEVASLRSSRRAVLQSRLEGYSDVIYKSGDPALVVHNFPDDLRVTVMDSLGAVGYDSFTGTSLSENHLGRPEVKDCLEKGFGYSIRHSETAGRELLYYAKSYPGGKIIRLSLPFEVNLRNFFKPDAMVIISIVLIFAVTMLLLLFLLQRYERRAEEEEHRRIRLLKNQMTSNISHELKTPVSAMQGYLETLSENPGMDPSRREGYIKRCYNQSLRLSELVRDISVITKMEEAPEKYPVETLKVRPICNQVFEEFSSQVKAAGVWVENEVDPGEKVYGNGNLIHSIFRNLVENTLKYAGDGVRIHLQSDGKGNFLYYDTGVGVPSGHLEDIFGRFYRLPKEGESGPEGSGLGLSIVKNAVVFHGGQITAFIPSGGGLGFRFSLPGRVQ